MICEVCVPVAGDTGKHKLEDRNMGKWNRWGRTLSVVVLAAAVVCGCGVKETLLSGRKSEREYGKAESMVIVTTERLRYEELYTDKIWDTVVDESGTTFEETLLSQIHDFLKELKTMSRMADEEKVTLSGKERELAKISRYKQSLYQDWKDGEITQQDYRDMKADYERQTIALTDVLTRLNAERAELANGVKSEHPALVAFTKHQNIDQLSRELLVELIDHIKVYENGNISVRFKFADEFRRIAEYIEINTTKPAVAG